MHRALHPLIVLGTVILLAPAYSPAEPLVVRPESAVRLAADGLVVSRVVYPDGDPDWLALAERLAEVLETFSGIRVPLVPDTDAVPQRLGPIPPGLADQNLILLGDLNTNRAIFPLYANYYVYCDRRYPGGTGYVLRTIVRPFGRDANYLLIGGSTPAGAQRGVEALTERLKTRVGGHEPLVPYLLEVELGPQLEAVFQPLLETAENLPATDEAGGYNYALQQFAAHAHLYFYTGRELFARRAREAALFLIEHDPRSIRTDDYKLEELAAAVRRVTPSPVFSEDERERLLAHFHRTVVEQDTAWWRQRGATDSIGGRHQTTGMLAWWSAIRVLLEIGQPDAAAREQLITWKRQCEDYLDGLLRHYSDDLDDYQSADSAQNTASYALQAGQLQWFTDGVGLQAVQRILAVTDNLGWHIGIQGYGEALPGWERFTLTGGMLMGACAFIYQDGSYLWLLDRFPALKRSWGRLQPWGLRQFDTGSLLGVRQPDWITGMKVLRLTPYRLEHVHAGRHLVPGLTGNPVSPDQAFDKLVIRPEADPLSPYLVLQGMSGISLSTIDPNALIRYTDQGGLWLVHNTAQRSLYFKNAVYVTSGLNEEPLPAACELVAYADFGESGTAGSGAAGVGETLQHPLQSGGLQVALAASRLPDYRGTNWTRNLISWWDPVAQRETPPPEGTSSAAQAFTVVIDIIQAERPDMYAVSCNWRTPVFASLEGHRWTARQDDVLFELAAGDADGLSSERLPMPDGATRPTVLRQIHRWEAGTGDVLSFENLLFTSSPERPQSYQLRRPAPGAVIIRNEFEPSSLYLAAACRGGRIGIELEEIRSDAAVLLLASDGVWFSGGTFLEFAGDTLIRRSHRGSLGWDFRNGQVVLPDGDGADLRLRIAGREVDLNRCSKVAGSEDVAERLRSFLAALWTDTAPVDQEDRLKTDATRQRPESGARSDGLEAGVVPLEEGRTVWSHPGAATRGGRIDGVRLRGVRHFSGPTEMATDWIFPTFRAEPRISPIMGSTIELVPAAGAGAARAGGTAFPPEPRLSPLREAEFILELPHAAVIGELAIYGETFGSTPAPLPPAQLELELTFSTDGFDQDIRSRRVSVPRTPSYLNLYKGHAYVFECYRLVGLQERAAAVRVRVLDGPAPELVLTDVQLRGGFESGGPERSQTPAAIPVEVRAIDLTGDGRDDVLSWTADGEIVAVEAGGRTLWRRALPAGIISVDAWDLEDDGQREIFISRTDWRIMVLNLDGSLRWERDWSDMHNRTDQRLYRDGSLVYGMAAWRPAPDAAGGDPSVEDSQVSQDCEPEADELEVIFTSYWYAARLDPCGKLLDTFNRDGHFTDIRMIPRGLENAGDLVMRSDIPWAGPVPLQWWSRTTRQPQARVRVPNGPIVFFEVGDFTGDGRAEALVAARQGIGMYRSSGPETLWEHLTEAPPVGAGVLPGSTPGDPPRIVYGREDGHVFILRPDGTLLRSILLDEPLTSLATATGRDGAVVLAGNSRTLRCLEADDLQEVWRRSGNYQRLVSLDTLLRAEPGGESTEGAGSIPPRHPSGEHILAVDRGGRLTVFNPFVPD